MAEPDLTLELAKVTDETTYQRDGSTVRMRRYDFFLGKFGPFVERIPATNFDEAEFMRRVEKLRTHLRLVHV